MYRSRIPSTNRLLSLGIAALSIGSADAQSPGELAFASADLNHSNSLHGAELRTILPNPISDGALNKLCKRIDLNNDEQISLKEYLVFSGERKRPSKQEMAFDALDQNVTGDLHLGELIEFTPGQAPVVSHIKTLMIADVDNNELITLQEWLDFKSGKTKPDPEDNFLVFDLANTFNVDDHLELVEYSAVLKSSISDSSLRKKFAKLDKNGDQGLTRDEFNPGARK